MSRSVAKNALFSGIRTVSYMLFPLITYPYATRVLLAENLGKIDFVTSVISYFALVAGLGITSYATREGAGFRQDERKISEFASQVFTVNFISTLISYVLLAILFLLWPQLRGYGLLVGIQAFTIIGNTLGIEWIYTIYEDYGYITLRTIVVQAMSAVLLFALVKQPSDYLIYAAIIVFSNVGANVFNYIHARRYVRIRLTLNFDVWQHLKPMLILFGNTIAVTIYVNTDVTLLGIFKGDHDVGIYGVAVRVYSIVKQLLNSVITVSLPRLSLYCSNKQSDTYESLLRSVAHGLTVTVFPILCIMFLMANYVVFIVGGNDFMVSAFPLQILCFAAVPAVFATFITNAILLPNKAERLVLKSTVVGAIVNFALNVIIIPLFGYNGAALTTTLAETSVFITALYLSTSLINVRSLFSHVVSPLITTAIGTVCMCIAYAALQHVVPFSILGFFICGLTLTILYLIVLLARKDTYAWSAVRLFIEQRPDNISDGNE